ncbi:Mitochondrial 39-s ribosomal protein l47 [Globisporangium polare]
MSHEGRASPHPAAATQPAFATNEQLQHEQQQIKQQQPITMFQLRRLMGSMRLSGGNVAAVPRRGIEEFFPVQNRLGEGAKPDNAAKMPSTVGTKSIPVGGDWKAWMLREKSTDDLHKLWYVLLKERNALLTERQQCRAKNIAMPNASRRVKVKKSMARLKLVLHERSEIYQANQAKKQVEQETVAQE